MSARAFLICNDQRALDTVTQVLGEFDVAFEHFQELAAAMKSLDVQQYDAVLIDCDDVTNASVVLNAARSSKLNQSATTVAIIDSKGGAPTAFRLGAQLVITKPVSLEQARSTLRNALALKKKQSESKAFAAAATTGMVTSPTIRQSVSAVAPKAEKTEKISMPAEPVGSPKMGSGLSADPKAATAARTKVHAVEGPESKPVAVKQELSVDDSSEVEEHGSPVVGSLPTFGMTGTSKAKKNNAALIGLLVLGLLGAGGYAAFPMVPSFHDMALAQYSSLRSLAGLGAASEAVAAQPVAATIKPAGEAAAQVVDGFAAPATDAAPNKAATSDGFTVTTPAQASAVAAQAAPITSSAKSATAQTAVPALVTPAAVSEMISVPSEIADAHVSYRVKPEYSEKLKRKKVQGSVVLLATVKADGTVDAVQVISGNPQLSPAAADAVKQWRYEPYLHNRQATPFQTQVTVNFENEKLQ